MLLNRQGQIELIYSHDDIWPKILIMAVGVYLSVSQFRDSLGVESCSLLA